MLSQNQIVTTLHLDYDIIGCLYNENVLYMYVNPNVIYDAQVDYQVHSQQLMVITFIFVYMQVYNIKNDKLLFA